MTRTPLALVLVALLAGGCSSTSSTEREDAPASSETTEASESAEPAPEKPATASPSPSPAAPAALSAEARTAAEDELLAAIAAWNGRDRPTDRMVALASSLAGESVGPRDVMPVASLAVGRRVNAMDDEAKEKWVVETMRAMIDVGGSAITPKVVVKLQALEHILPRAEDGRPDASYIDAAIAKHDPALKAAFDRFQCRAKQSEAKANLKSLYVAEESFRAELDTYDTDLDKLGFAPHSPVVRYEYEVVEATPTSFKAVARGKAEHMAGDEWTITQHNDLINTKNGCE